MTEAIAHRVARGQGSLPASMEMSARQLAEPPEAARQIPGGTRIYIPDLGVDTEDALVAAARRVRDLGWVAVPHVAARRLSSRQQLETRVRRLSEEAGVGDMLVIGGGVRSPRGPFTSTMDVLETGLLADHGIRHLAVAGHPEGSPDMSRQEERRALLRKLDYARETGTKLRIVTQFGFDGEAFARWAGALRTEGIAVPVHIGIAGPARLATLIKYAMICGIGNSLDFVRRRGGALASLTRNQSPEIVAQPLERHVLQSDTGIVQLHVYPFGGLKASIEWLRERGSWPDG